MRKTNGTSSFYRIRINKTYMLSSVDPSTFSAATGCACCPEATASVALPPSCAASRMFAILLVAQGSQQHLRNAAGRAPTSSWRFTVADPLHSGDPFTMPSADHVTRATAALERAAQHAPRGTIVLPLPSAWATTANPRVGHMLALFVFYTPHDVRIFCADALPYKRKTAADFDVYTKAKMALVQPFAASRALDRALVRPACTQVPNECEAWVSWLGTVAASGAPLDALRLACASSSADQHRTCMVQWGVEAARLAAPQLARVSSTVRLRDDEAAALRTALQRYAHRTSARVQRALRRSRNMRQPAEVGAYLAYVLSMQKESTSA